MGVEIGNYIKAVTALFWYRDQVPPKWGKLTTFFVKLGIFRRLVFSKGLDIYIS